MPGKCRMSCLESSGTCPYLLSLSSGTGEHGRGQEPLSQTRLLTCSAPGTWLAVSSRLPGLLLSLSVFCGFFFPSLKTHMEDDKTLISISLSPFLKTKQYILNSARLPCVKISDDLHMPETQKR